jgi:hypothetical protein
MKEANSFDHQDDPELGRLLREHLEPADHSAFVARVRRAVRLRHHADSWDILARWLYPGMAAAAILGGLLGLWNSTRSRRARELQAARSEPTMQWVAPETALSRDVVVRVVLEGR